MSWRYSPYSSYSSSSASYRGVNSSRSSSSGNATYQPPSSRVSQIETSGTSGYRSTRDQPIFSRPPGQTTTSTSQLASSSSRVCRSFDPAEWKVQRCQRRLANLRLDSAFDKAEERMAFSARKWSRDYESRRSELRQLEDKVASQPQGIATRTRIASAKGTSRHLNRFRRWSVIKMSCDTREVKFELQRLQLLAETTVCPLAVECLELGPKLSEDVEEEEGSSCYTYYTYSDSEDDAESVASVLSITKDDQANTTARAGHAEKVDTNNNSIPKDTPGTEAPETEKKKLPKQCKNHLLTSESLTLMPKRFPQKENRKDISNLPVTVTCVQKSQENARSDIKSNGDQVVRDLEYSSATQAGLSDEKVTRLKPDTDIGKSVEQHKVPEGKVFVDHVAEEHVKITAPDEAARSVIGTTATDVYQAVPKSGASSKRRSSCSSNASSCSSQSGGRKKTWTSARSKKDKDLSWLNKDEDLVIDSMHRTLEKWLQGVRESRCGDPDPLNSLKGKASGTVLVGTKCTDPYPRLRDEVYQYQGQTNYYGKPHGKGKVTFENGDQFSGEFRNGEREGPGTLKTSRQEIVYIDGSYVKDKLEGKCRLEYRNGDILHAFVSAGTLHGLGKLYTRSHELKQVGWYAHGRLHGLVWQFLAGGGCLVGEVDVTGQLIGQNVAFLFPDWQTALLGTFIRDQMVMAQTCFLQLVSVRNEMCHVKFTQPRGPFYEHDPGTPDGRICREPMLPDPYESQYCYVKTSRIKGAKEGVFAKRDLAKDFIVCFYNGVRMRSDQLDADRDDWEANAYKIVDLQGEDEHGIQGILDIPAEYVSLKRYRASLAHKVNHSFQPNGKFVLFHHPRFGPVPAVKTIESVDKDDEVTVSYDYAMDEAPPWYQELFTQRIIEQYRQSKMWNF